MAKKTVAVKVKGKPIASNDTKARPPDHAPKAIINLKIDPKRT